MSWWSDAADTCTSPAPIRSSPVPHATTRPASVKPPRCGWVRPIENVPPARREATLPLQSAASRGLAHVPDAVDRARAERAAPPPRPLQQPAAGAGEMKLGPPGAGGRQLHSAARERDALAP